MVTFRDLARLGLDAQTAHRWTRKGYLRAENPHPGCGQLRLWLPGEDRIARVMIFLVRQAGLTPAVAATVARNGGWLAPGVRVVFTDRAIA